MVADILKGKSFNILNPSFIYSFILLDFLLIFVEMIIAAVEQNSGLSPNFALSFFISLSVSFCISHFAIK